MLPNLKRKRTENTHNLKINLKQSKTLTRNCYSNYSKYPRKKKCKCEMERYGFLSGKKTRVSPKKLHFVKIAGLSWNIFNENIVKSVTDNSICEKL